MPESPEPTELPMNKQGVGLLSPFDNSRPDSPVHMSRWRDPRLSSTQSLVPSESDASAARQGKRKLLMIYVHGFYGNDHSFKSFPAHTHAYLKDALHESHVVHSKIYPRYKTYHAVQVGAQSFSSWLEPHEDETTDVVLVGHSMGGILAAEAILMPNPNPFGTHPFKHRILGVIALDTPFLGLHPGIIPTGIASLFRGSPENTSINVPEASVGQSRSAPDPSQELSNISTTTSTSQSTYTIDETSTQPTARTSSDSIRPSMEATRNAPPPYNFSQPPFPQDPHFNPPWFNDNVRRDRSFFKGIAHFTRKHLSEGVFNAAWKHVLSHMEYGSCLADYPGLHDRYNRLRALENVDDIKALMSDIVTDEPNFRLRPVRVRFANYYTSSTGRIKPEKVEGKDKKAKEPSAENNDEAETKPSPQRISVEPHEDDEAPEPQLLPPIPIPEDDDTALREPQPPMEPEIEGLPDIPPPPTPPPQPPSPSSFPDKASRKQAEKEAKTLQKEYERALKAREKLIKQRNKLIEKHHRRQAKLLSDQARAPINDETDDNDNDAGRKDAKEKKPRKFCALPRKRNGEPDTAWVSVFMDGVDEVGAHCGLFLPDGPHYDRLVGDVAQRVVGWVQDDLSRRAIAEMGVS